MAASRIFSQLLHFSSISVTEFFRPNALSENPGSSGSNGMNEPLMSDLVDDTCQKDSSCAVGRRRFRRIRSAPLAEHVPADVHVDRKGDAAVPLSEFILRGLHPSFRKVAIFLAAYLGLGTVCFYLVRNQISGTKTNAVLDAAYFCIVTMTSVGYGDLVPNSTLTKLFACVFVFTGMALVGLVLSKAADYLVEKQELLLVKGFHLRQKVGTSEIIKELENYKARYKFILTSIILLVLMLVGTIFLAKVEKLDLVDAFYCVCATITSLGYGDQSFKSEGGRVFAVFWILAGTICVAQFFLYLAELNAENRQRELAKWVLTRKTTISDLEAADIDADGVVRAADFVLYKLKEMGKISQEDISLVMEEFEELDVDHSGTLSISDIVLAQSSEDKR